MLPDCAAYANNCLSPANRSTEVAGVGAGKPCAQRCRPRQSSRFDANAISDWCCLRSSFGSRCSGLDLPWHHLNYQFSQLAIVTSATLPRLREPVKSAARCVRAPRTTIEAFQLIANFAQGRGGSRVWPVHRPTPCLIGADAQPDRSSYPFARKARLSAALVPSS